MAIIAEFKNGATKTYTKSAYQFDKGQVLTFFGITLPESCEIHASNSKYSDTAMICKSQGNDALLPDILFMSGDFVYVWVYVITTGENITSQSTLYEVVIPVIRRPGSMLTSTFYSAPEIYI